MAMSFGLMKLKAESMAFDIVDIQFMSKNKIKIII